MPMRGCNVLYQPNVSFKVSHKSNNMTVMKKPQMSEASRHGRLGVSVDMTRVFTIFWVEPLVSV